MLPYIFWAIALLAQQTFADEPEPIVGGTRALPGEFPYQCSLRTYGSHFCGGSIIAPNKILTAAHCVEDLTANKIQVVTATISAYTGTYHNVKKIVIHPQYSNKQQDAWKNDVAVLILESPMQYTNLQKPIPLAFSTPGANQMSILAGWGQTDANRNSVSRELLKLNQRIVSKSECQRAHSRMPLTAGHLCALSAYGSGGCMGDSGGPLVSNGVQVGLISWVAPCGVGLPDVFSDVSYYRNWIDSV